jgi:hypothetical protein
LQSNQYPCWYVLLLSPLSSLKSLYEQNFVGIFSIRYRQKTKCEFSPSGKDINKNN